MLALPLTCFVCENSNTLCPCSCHIFNKASTTIILPDRLGSPYPSSGSGSSSSALSPSSAFRASCLAFSREPAVDVRSGWLQIFRSMIRPGNTLSWRTKQKLKSWFCGQQMAYVKNFGILLHLSNSAKMYLALTLVLYSTTGFRHFAS